MLITILLKLKFEKSGTVVNAANCSKLFTVDIRKDQKPNQDSNIFYHFPLKIENLTRNNFI